jgi:hypothetical protein
MLGEKAAMADKTVEQHRAERLRLRLAQGFTEIKPPESADKPPENAQALMSDRQKTKADKRREKQQRHRYGSVIREHNKKNGDREKDAGSKTKWESLIASADPVLSLGWATKPSWEIGDSNPQLQSDLAKIGTAKQCLSIYDKMSQEEREALPIEQRLRVEEIRAQLPASEKTLKLAFMANGVDYYTGEPVEASLEKWAKKQLGDEIGNYSDSIRSAKERTAAGFEGYAEEKIDEKLGEPEFQANAQAAKRVQEQKHPYLKDIPVEFNPRLPIQAKEYMNLRTAVDGHPEKYGEHKDVIDQMLAEYIDVWNMLSRELIRFGEAQKLGNEANDAGNILLGKTYESYKRTMVERHIQPIENRMSLLRDMTRCLLGDREFTDDTAWIHAQLENEFGVVTERRRAEKAELASAEDRPATIKRLGGSPEFPYTDEAIRAVKELAADNRQTENFEKELCPSMDETRRLKLDRRAIRCFSRGYEINKDGEPATLEDQRKKEADEQYIREYISEDPAVKSRQLDRITDELLTIQVPDGDMLTEKYILDNVLNLKRNSEKLCYIENVINENKGYFEKLPKDRMAHLEALMRLYPPYICFFTDILKNHRVDRSECRLISEEMAMASYPEVTELYKNLYLGRLAEYRNSKK